MTFCQVFGKTENDIASHSTEVWWIWPLNVEGINGTVSCSLYKSNTAVWYTGAICIVMLYIMYEKFSVQHINKQLPNIHISACKSQVRRQFHTILLNQVF